MKAIEAWYYRRLDRLSGTYPNDERTSRINEKGFALCGLFYIAALAVRTVRVLIDRQPFVNRHLNPAISAPAVFGVMLLIVLGITVKQRRKEAPMPEKKHVKLRLTELPRAAAALLSGKSPEDERTVLAFERGFAFCALLGFAYYGICLFLTVWCPYLFFNFFCMCAAPVLLGIVKLRENILTPPRAAHIRLNTEHFLLRLPVYALAAFPFFFIAVFYPTVYDTMGNVGDGQIKISESYFGMFWQLIGMSCKRFVSQPIRIAGGSWLIFAAGFLVIALIHEYAVLLFRKQMTKMDAEENDLS